jgi:hypothetical protein
MRLNSTRTDKAIGMSIVCSIQWRMPRRAEPGFRAVMPPRAAPQAKGAPSRLGAAARTSGTRTARARATLALCALTCTKDSRFVLESVSSIHIPKFGRAIAKGG